MNKSRTAERNFILLLLAGILLVAAGIVAATCFGAKQISLQTVWDSLFSYREEMDHMLVRDARLPRAVSSMLVGGMLALTGAVMQGITRNPVAEPSVLGMSQGATLAVAISYVLLGIGMGGGLIAMAMAGSIVSGGFILLISLRNPSNLNLSKLLLAGTAASTFMLSLASTVALLGNRSQELAFWIAGGFGNTDWNDVRILLIFGGIASCLLFLLAGKINILNLGEETAIGLGIHPSRLRVIAIALMIPICAACVSVSGNIVFVGLVVPHIMRRLIGSDYHKLLPLSFLYGSVLLVWADILAKMVNLPYETPIGLFTAMIGVPFFLLLVRKEKG